MQFVIKRPISQTTQSGAVNADENIMKFNISRSTLQKSIKHWYMILAFHICSVDLRELPKQQHIHYLQQVFLEIESKGCCRHKLQRENAHLADTISYLETSRLS